MNALQRFFANGHAKPGLPDEVEVAVAEMLREAEELRQLLRIRRAGPRADANSLGVTD